MIYQSLCPWVLLIWDNSYLALFKIGHSICHILPFSSSHMCFSSLENTCLSKYSKLTYIRDQLWWFSKNMPFSPLRLIMCILFGNVYFETSALHNRISPPSIFSQWKSLDVSLFISHTKSAASLLIYMYMCSEQMPRILFICRLFLSPSVKVVCPMNYEWLRLTALTVGLERLASVNLLLRSPMGHELTHQLRSAYSTCTLWKLWHFAPFPRDGRVERTGRVGWPGFKKFTRSGQIGKLLFTQPSFCGLRLRKRASEWLTGWVKGAPITLLPQSLALSNIPDMGIISIFPRLTHWSQSLLRCFLKTLICVPFCSWKWRSEAGVCVVQTSIACFHVTNQFYGFTFSPYFPTFVSAVARGLFSVTPLTSSFSSSFWLLHKSTSVPGRLSRLKK